MTGIDFSKLSVLIVDDEKFMRDLVLRVLNTFGVTDVRQASDGADAIKALKAEDFDLMILDIDMPVLSGVETLRMVRAGEGRNGPAELPVVMLTGHSSMDNIAEAVNIGVHGWLAKPVSIDGLRKMVERALTQAPIDPATLTKGARKR